MSLRIGWPLFTHAGTILRLENRKMTCKKTTNLAKPVLLILCALAFPLSASRAAANSKNETAAKVTTIVVNRKEMKATLLRIISRKARTNPKFAKALSATCGCALVQDDEDAFGSCLKNCIAGWGVNYGSLLACGATCGAASTGNPIFIALCAGCLGTAEWIVAGCALSCVWSPGTGGRTGTILGKNLNHKTSGTVRTQAAKLKLKTAGVRS